MENQELAKQVQKLRKKRGLSQELLAEESGLNLRTIQRIESGTSEPRGDTLKRLATSLNVSTDEIMDEAIIKDQEYLVSLNLSSLSFLLFPLLGILVPLIMWVSKKDKIKDLNHTAREVLNFQILWTIVLFIGFIILTTYNNYRIQQINLISPEILETPWIYYVVIGLLYALNIILVIVNTFRLKSGRKAEYTVKMNFIR